MSAPLRFAVSRRPAAGMDRGQWLAETRAIARRLARANGSVTIDEVRALCPPPDDQDPRLMGGVFKSREFEPCGYVKSVRRECHQRPVSVFRLSPGADRDGDPS